MHDQTNRNDPGIQQAGPFYHDPKYPYLAQR